MGEDGYLESTRKLMEVVDKWVRARVCLWHEREPVHVHVRVCVCACVCMWAQA